MLFKILLTELATGVIVHEQSAEQRGTTIWNRRVRTWRQHIEQRRIVVRVVEDGVLCFDIPYAVTEVVNRYELEKA